MRANGITILIIFGLVLGAFMVPISGDLLPSHTDEMTMSRATITIGPTGDYTTIQEGIQAAASGDTLQVSDGVYAEFIIIPTGKTIHLVGQGPDLTTIGGGHTSMSSVTLDGNGSSIKGFSIKGSGSGDWNAGIFIRASSVNIEDCSIDGNDGTGIILERSSGSTFKDLEIINNKKTGFSILGGSGNSLENITVNSNLGDGFYVHNSSSNSFTDCNVKDNSWTGFSIHNTPSNVIEDCMISNNDGDGILLFNSNSTRVTNTNVSFNQYSGFSVQQSSSNTFEDCSAYFNDADGIYITGGTGNLIKGGTISENVYSGISLSSTNTNTISDCRLLTNGYSSINLAGSDSNIITENKFLNSLNYGIQINDQSCQNLIYLNTFINNKPGEQQALDDAVDNQWSKDMQGNYWSDWTWPDADGDGIIDNPYWLHGVSEVNDSYPLSSEPGKPRIFTDDVWHAHENTKYEVQYGASDLDTNEDDLVWLLETNASWLSIDGDEILYGTPETEDIGSYYVNITVSDGTNVDVHRFTITVWNVNDPPKITTSDLKTVNQGEEYYVDYGAVDPDPTKDKLMWHMHTNAWNFLNIDQTSGVVSGTPSNDDVGDYFVNIWVEDGKGLFDETNFTLKVLNVNDPPQIRHAIWDFSIDEDGSDSSITMDWWFEDIDGDKLTYRAEGNEHIDVSFADDGRVTLTPASDWFGEEEITFFASDGSLEANDTVLITVNSVNDAPTSVRIKLEEIDYIQGEPQPVHGVAMDADDPSGESLTYIWTSNWEGELGRGKDINLTMQAGMHTLTLRVEDPSGAFEEDSVDIEVLPPKEDTDDKGFLANYWWLIIVVVLVLVMIIVIIVIVMKKKKKDDELTETEDDEEADDAKEEEEEEEPEQEPETTSPEPLVDDPEEDAIMPDSSDVEEPVTKHSYEDIYEEPSSPKVYGGAATPIEPEIVTAEEMGSSSSTIDSKPSRELGGRPINALPAYDESKDGEVKSKLGGWALDDDGSSAAPKPAKEASAPIVLCYNCNGEVPITSEKRPLIVECPNCGVKSQLE